MLKRLGSALIFVAGSSWGAGTRLLIIALRPDLIRGPTRSPGPALPAADRTPGRSALPTRPPCSAPRRPW